MAEHPSLQSLRSRLADSESEYLDAITNDDYPRAIRVLEESKRILLVMNHISRRTKA